jgi:hypothetical protein
MACACALAFWKSQKSLEKIVIIFSDIFFRVGPREELTGSQLLKLRALNSSVAYSYEHLSV